MDKRKNNGGHSTKPTNPNDLRLATKTDLQLIHERLEPFTNDAITKHAEAITKGERWAIELFYKYRYGMPKQVIDQNTNLNVNEINLKELLNFDNTKQ